MTRSGLIKYLRWLQTHAPWAIPLKFGAYNTLARYFGLCIEPEFGILKHLTGIALAVDVGGNHGQSIVALRRMSPRARVVSFEPNPVLAARLAAAFAKDRQVEVRNLALSSASGRATLYVPAYRGFVFDGIAALDRDAAAHWLNAQRMAFFDRAKLTISSHEVTAVPLDSLALPADFIKIDVQGHELEVLGGATETLARRPVVVLESATLEIVRLLAKYGLKPYHFTGNKLAIMQSTNNTIFLTDGHVARSQLQVSRFA